MGIAIVTDSSCDMLAAQAGTLGVDIVPLWVIFGNERLRDGVDITRDTFYKRFAIEDQPRTEPLDIAGFEAVFAKHVNRGDECVVPIVSSKLSKTYEIAKAAAGKFGDKVHVVDSETLSGGLLLLAMVAGEMAKAGANAKDIVAAIEGGKATQKGYYIVPTLEYLGRSGRLNKAIVALGTMLKVNPILQVRGGIVETAGQTRDYEKAKDLIIDIVTQHVHDVRNTRFAVGHTHEPALADQIATVLRAKLVHPAKSFTVYEVGPTVAVNTGPGACAVFSTTGV